MGHQALDSLFQDYPDSNRDEGQRTAPEQLEVKCFTLEHDSSAECEGSGLRPSSTPQSSVERSEFYFYSLPLSPVGAG